MQMNILKTAIVDDEVHARNILSDYVRKVDNLELVHTSGSALDLRRFMQTSPLDLVFLDINMPELSGLEFLQSLTHPLKVVLTTAYSEFALESYEYGVIDYLLKPVKFSRFLKAVNKVTGLPYKVTAKVRDDITEEVIEIKHDGILLSVPVALISYIKSFGNYLRIITPERTYITMDTMTNMERRLPEQFQRIHKSYIIDIRKIKKLSNTSVFLDQKEIPLSPMYRLLLQEKIKKK